MSDPAIQTALNVLAILEEEIPDEGRRLRRMLPALALDFAKAGFFPSEKQMLTIILDAMAEGKSLQSLFNGRKTKTPVHDYSMIAARLTEGCKRPDYVERIVRFGLCDAYRKYSDLLAHDYESYETLAIEAAARGHTDFTLYLLSHDDFNQAAVSACLRTAARESQYHLAYSFLNGAFRADPDLKEEFFQSLTGEQLAGYKKFGDKYLDFKKSSSADYDGDFLTGLEFHDLAQLKLKQYLSIRTLLASEIENIRERNRQAYKATILFQSPDRLLRMLDRWGERASNPLDTMLSQIDIPYGSYVNWPMWGDALLKHGMKMAHLVFFADKMPTPARNHKGEISLRRTSYGIWQKILTRPAQRVITEYAEDLNDDLNMKYGTFREASKIWRSVLKKSNPPPEKSVPDIEFDADFAGLPGYKLVKFPYTDPRIMFLGYYTGCCEKIGDDFQATILHALRTRESGFYVLMKDNTIAAHSWAWRGKQGQLVIDGWESKDLDVDSIKLDYLTHEIADIAATEPYKEFRITDVILGVCNPRFSIEQNLNPAANPAIRFLFEKYHEGFGIHQWQVKRIAEPPRNLQTQYYRPYDLG